MRSTFCVLLMCLLASCIQQGEIGKRVRESEEKYNAALADGMKNRTVMEFHKVFPSAFSWISYFTGEYGTPEWNSNVGLHDRYVLTMKSEIELDQSRTKVVRFGDPRFMLIEVEGVYPGPDGRYKIKYGETQINFGVDKWETIKQDGDFSRIGVVLEKNRPVPGFSNALTRN